MVWKKEVVSIAFDIDHRMLVYLDMITVGIFIFSIASDSPYYLVIGIALVVISGFLGLP
jgi:hypothetical protein